MRTGKPTNSNNINSCEDSTSTTKDSTVLLTMETAIYVYIGPKSGAFGFSKVLQIPMKGSRDDTDVSVNYLIQSHISSYTIEKKQYYTTKTIPQKGHITVNKTCILGVLESISHLLQNSTTCNFQYSRYINTLTTIKIMTKHNLNIMQQ